MAIMDLDTSIKSQQSDDITDEARLAASSKRVTLTPLHKDVEIDSPYDDATGSHNVIEPPIGNIAIDQENTAALIRESAAAENSVIARAEILRPKSKMSLPLLIAMGACLVVAGTAFTLLYMR